MIYIFQNYQNTVETHIRTENCSFQTNSQSFNEFDSSKNSTVDSNSKQKERKRILGRFVAEGEPKEKKKRNIHKCMFCGVSYHLGSFRAHCEKHCTSGKLMVPELIDRKKRVDAYYTKMKLSFNEADENSERSASVHSISSLKTNVSSKQMNVEPPIESTECDTGNKLLSLPLSIAVEKWINFQSNSRFSGKLFNCKKTTKERRAKDLSKAILASECKFVADLCDRAQMEVVQMKIDSFKVKNHSKYNNSNAIVGFLEFVRNELTENDVEITYIDRAISRQVI